jgi:hypothetical protein
MVTTNYDRYKDRREEYSPPYHYGMSWIIITNNKQPNMKFDTKVDPTEDKIIDSHHREEELTTRIIESFQIDSQREECHNKFYHLHKFQFQRNSSCWVLSRYFILSTGAVLLTYYCPQTNQSTYLEVWISYILIWISLLILHKSNPGYLEGDALIHICNEDGMTLLGYETKSLEQSEIHPPSPPFSQSLDNNSGPVFQGTRRKHCQPCNMAPPLRSHHCRVCDKCVATFDHHCHFIGTCIGERNHCRFWIFLTFQTIGFICCSSIVMSSSMTWTAAIFHPEIIYQSILLIVSQLYIGILTGISFLMWILHTFLACSNKTTFECGKGPERIDYLKGTRCTDAPFSRGCIFNLRQFCWSRNKTPWLPIVWHAPGKIIRDSDDIWEHPWENKYWTCC